MNFDPRHKKHRYHSLDISILNVMVTKFDPRIKSIKINREILVTSFKRQNLSKIFKTEPIIILICIQQNLKLNKAHSSDKETSFLDVNIKVIGSYIHTSVYDKRNYFGFPIVNFLWLSGDVPRLSSYGICISQLVTFARCCTSVLDFLSGL